VKTVGVIALVLVGVVAVSAAVLGVRSVPDVRRYLEIRRM
jgi:hypothetical protein